MANFSEFTLTNGAVTDINKVMFDAIFKFGDLFGTCTPMIGVRNGDKADAVDKMSDVGWAGRGCDPQYKDIEITGREQEWELGKWSAPLEFCYERLETTIANYCLRTGTPRENVIGTEFWDKIFLPLLKDAFDRMYWRYAWFSDKDAEVIANGGVLKAGTDKTLFTMADGLWKRIFAATSGNKTAIAANSQTTYALQQSKLREDGVAISIFESILADANALIDNGVLMVTKSLADALRKDYRREFKATIPFYEVAEGVKLETFDGVPIKPVPEWDTIIREFEDDGTKWNNPHRAVFANIDNLLVGTSDKSLFAELTIGFDDKTRKNYTYAASDVGTIITNPALVQAAY